MSDLTDLKQRARTDGMAAMQLAECHMLGIDTKPNARLSFDAVRHAAALGNEDGRRALVYLTAAGIGTRSDPNAARKLLTDLAQEDRFAAVQLKFLYHLTSEARLAEVEPRIIRDDPYVALYPGLFSAAECRYLMVLGSPWIEKAFILGSDGQPQLDPVRDAHACSFPPLAEDLVVQAVNRTIATATGTQTGWGEPLNILKYTPGQQYRPHHDGTGSDRVSVRNLTALVWLNDEFEGGETDFPKIGIKVRGMVGDMLVFRNVHDDGSFDERMMHAGLPVTRGVKWMASRWIRGSSYLKG